MPFDPMAGGSGMSAPIHVLPPSLDEYERIGSRKISFDPPARFFAFAVLIVGAAIGHIGNARLLVIAGWFFFAGILLFSGSLYALALTSVRILGAITPVGGLLFLIGWACLAVFALIR